MGVSHKGRIARSGHIVQPTPNREKTVDADQMSLGIRMKRGGGFCDVVAGRRGNLRQGAGAGYLCLNGGARVRYSISSLICC